MREAVSFLESQLTVRPEVGIVLGSGLGAFATELNDAREFPYEQIPGWPQSTAIGHAGKLVFGNIAGTEVVCMAGRAHFYEGYNMAQVTMGVRVLAQLGIQALTLTNAAGGINLAYSRGALVLIHDHINLQGANPLIGPNDDQLGPRFPDMTEAYSKRFRALAHDVAREMDFTFPEGVYAALTGPSYETPAEIRYLRAIGADLVGMSTVPEVIIARHMEIPVLAISCVTNMAAGVTGENINHEEVLETGREVRGRLVDFMKRIIPRLV
jgi:purine-nucleoside phosphorylase